MKKAITIALLVIIGLPAGAWLFGKAYDAHMTQYCTSLKAQAEEYKNEPLYFISELDHKECGEVYDIHINAHVGDPMIDHE